jgi:hypothetical protein
LGTTYLWFVVVSAGFIDLGRWFVAKRPYCCQRYVVQSWRVPHLCNSLLSFRSRSHWSITPGAAIRQFASTPIMWKGVFDVIFRKAPRMLKTTGKSSNLSSRERRTTLQWPLHPAYAPKVLHLRKWACRIVSANQQQCVQLLLQEKLGSLMAVAISIRIAGTFGALKETAYAFDAPINLSYSLYS